ncbi:MAG: glycosyltransferase [Actinomycetota bacterium]
MSFTSALLLLAGSVYALLTIGLIAFGANLLALSVVALRRGRVRESAVTESSDLPSVTVQLPIYNELYVAERVIEAAAALDYPSELLQIQVLDDSADETVQIVAAAVRRAREGGASIEVVRRPDRMGFKAGALANGLRSATGELVAIFDADFVPSPDFLRRAVPHFEPGVAFVQGRWGHLNRDQSWLTRMQAVAMDGHFLVEQAARGERGWWFNFNGTAGVWRREAIEEAGGWQAETLTEDLDLSYRAHLHGWRGRFVEDLVVPGEVPAQLSGFRRQQHRWARGSLECARKLLPAVWRSHERLGVKVQASLHLLSYSIHLLLVGVVALYPVVVVAAEEHPQLRTLAGLAYPFALFSLAPLVFFAVGQVRQGRAWWREAPRMAMLTLIGPGMMVNTLRAALAIVRRPDEGFERTAKFGAAPPGRPDGWKQQRYQLRSDRIVVAELLLGVYALGAAWLAFDHRNWAVVTYATLFGLGLVVLAAVTVVQDLDVHRHRHRRAARRRDEERVVARLAAGQVASS